MNDYATKPIRRKTLIEVLMRWCGANQKEAVLASDVNADPAVPALMSAPSPANSARSDEGLEGMPSSAAVDRRLLAEAEATLGDRFPVILEIFLEDATKYIAQIASGLASKDKEAIAIAAHPLKSSSSEIGAIGLSELAGNIEEKAWVIAGDGDFAAIESIAERLKISFEEVRSQLETVIAKGNIGNGNAPKASMQA